MTLRIASFLAVALVALAGCDTVGDATPAPTADAKLRHWELDAARALVGNARLKSATVDFVVTFQNTVTDPEAEAEHVFCGQRDIRVRAYVRDTFKGIAGTVSADSLTTMLDCLIEDPDVAFVEPDLGVDVPAETYEYVTLRRGDDDDDDDGDDVSGGSGGYSASTFGRLAYVSLASSNALRMDDDDDDDSDQVLTWNVKKIQGDDSSARSGDGRGSVNVDVFIIDTDVDHPEVDVVSRRSFLPAGVSAASTAHGNHVALTIAAFDDRRGMVGVAPGARIHALSVFDAAGAAPMSRLIEAVDHVAAWKRANPSKPAVVNMSVGSFLGMAEHNALDDAVQALIDLGVPVVVSAGNHQVDASLVSPAHVRDAITVAAYSENHRFASAFSNFGPLVDLLAPGVRVISGADSGRHALMDGTSMAAPHVTGAVALYLARNPSADARRAASEVIRLGRDRFASYAPSGTTRRTVWLDRL